MRIETNLIRKEHDFCDLPVEKKPKKNRRRKKRSMPTAVQKLFETCKDVFKGPGTVPSPPEVQRIQDVLDSMKPVDVGLSEDMPYFRTSEDEGSPPVTYLHLYDCENFSICIFCLPPSGVIPLHNHPGMTVFSKILFGSMHIKSYDWDVGPASTNGHLGPSHSLVRLAKVKANSVFTAPCDTSILYPASGGNMHRFTALTSSAVLDVLGPPYSTDESDPEGRHCMYYRDFPYQTFSGDAVDVGDEGAGRAWLEEMDDKPDDLVVVGAEYKGPKIVEN